MGKRWGALPGEWAHLDLVLGLTADLLPVVSNPDAPISPGSKMKALGKTPSHYNKSRNVAGIADWTNKISTTEEVSTWEKEPDYGICIQTRNVRAIDIDVGDVELCGRITAFISAQGQTFPKRFRGNSAKCLLAFRVGGEIAKRVIKCAEGIIEFLGNGQQFISHGTHTSGARYEWDWHDHDDFPTLSADTFENLWESLVKEFGTESSSKEIALRKKEKNLDIDDPWLEQLPVLGWGKNGEAHVECPWKAEHTSDSGITETSYFPAGTRGYEQGHFKCLHAHCQARTDAEFAEAFGLTVGSADDFDIVGLPATEKEYPRPKLKHSDAGRPLAVINNLCEALRNPEFCGWKIAHDDFLDLDMRQDADTDMQWQPFTDEDYTTLQCHLESKRRFMPIAYQHLVRAVQKVCSDNHFDSAQIWLNSLEWDGVPRVDTFMHRIMGAEDSEYPTAVSRYIWSALAGRILKPGVKADMMLILQGDEGLLKSSIIAALVPDPRFFITLRFDDDEKELARKMRGKLVAEIAELRGLGTRDIETIKDFIVRQVEEWIPKFKEKAITFPRRLLFFGTTNDEQFLPVEGKKRRFLPIVTGKVDLTLMEHTRLQLWAEGRELFMKHGVLWQDAERLASKEHTKFVSPDSWDSYITDWLHTVDEMDGSAPISRPWLCGSAIFREALGIEAKALKGHEGRRVGKILKPYGYKHTLKRIEGKPQWVWLKVGGGSIDDLV